MPETTPVPFLVVTDDDFDHFYLAVSAESAMAQFQAERPGETLDVVRPATLDDAPWTIDRCSPTDDPDWWQADKPCDYDLGEKRTCHHPVHAFQKERGPARHLIEASLAKTASKYGWWSDLT